MYFLDAHRLVKCGPTSRCRSDEMRSDLYPSLFGLPRLSLFGLVSSHTIIYQSKYYSFYWPKRLSVSCQSMEPLYFSYEITYEIAMVRFDLYETMKHGPCILRAI